MLAVTHDRYFLDHVAEWILEIDAGKVFTFKGNYNDWLAAKQVRNNICISIHKYTYIYWGE